MFGPLAAAGLLIAVPGCDLDIVDDDDGYASDEGDGDDGLDDGQDQGTDEPVPSDHADEAPIDLGDALEIAEQQFPGATIIEAYPAGGNRWAIELYEDGIEFEVYVSQIDGSILDTDQDRLDAEDAIEAGAAAALVRSSPGWSALVDTAESAAGGLAVELDVDAEEALLEVYVEATRTWVVEFDAAGEVLDIDPV